MNSKKIYLVRHGESRGNKDKSEYFRHLDCDIELTDKGKKDAIGAADRIMTLGDNYNNKRFGLYHSTYKRARQTSNIIHGRITGYVDYVIDRVEESPLIREREWGDLRSIVTSGEKNEDHFNFHYRPNGGESFADAYQRAVIFHQHLMASTPYEHNIIVAHGEFNKCYMMYLLGWNVNEFTRYANSKNGQVFVIDTKHGLSDLTPLTIKHQIYSR